MILISMVAGAAVPILGAISGHTARIGITSGGLRSFGGQFAQSLPFGAGYSLGTYLGFPKNYQSQPIGSNTSPTYELRSSMPLGS